MENKSLKEIRKSKNITQDIAANFCNISLRSYKSYENDLDKKDSIKYKYLCEQLDKYGFIDESHGVLTIEQIKSIVKDVFTRYDINFCYLFGSYSKGKANENSDIDLIIDSDITGLDFYGLVEDLRTNLRKKIDLLKINQLENNISLLKEILKDGVKIFDK